MVFVHSLGKHETGVEAQTVTVASVVAVGLYIRINGYLMNKSYPGLAMRRRGLCDYFLIQNDHSAHTRIPFFTRYLMQTGLFIPHIDYFLRVQSTYREGA